MTDEEIEKKAKERFSKHCAEDYCYPSRSDLELYKDGYKDGATNTIKELLDILEKDIFFGDGIMCRLYNIIIKKMGIKLND